MVHRAGSQHFDGRSVKAKGHAAAVAQAGKTLWKVAVNWLRALPFVKKHICFFGGGVYLLFLGFYIFSRGVIILSRGFAFFVLALATFLIPPSVEKQPPISERERLKPGVFLAHGTNLRWK